MRIITTYQRYTPDTNNGEQIAVTTVYSSHNKAEIDEVEKTLRQKIGSGVISEVKETK